MTVERTQYFKHVFAGSERIAIKPCGEPSRTKGFGFMVMPSPPGQGDPNDTVAVPFVPTMATQQAGPSFGFADRPQAWSQYLSSIGECASGVASFNLLGAMQFTGAYNTHIRNLATTPVENQLYFYHTDHLGSSGFISRLVTSGAGIGTGRLTQHYQYTPFGENFIHQKGTSHSYHNPYEFNGKEKDLETGYNYYGARHYNAAWGVWLSVDPLADEFPSWTPYHYVHNNPINLIDPDGRSAAPIFSEQGELLGTDSEGWKGEAIVMDKKDFKQGMDHNQALEKGTELSKYGKGVRISNDDWQEVEKNGGSEMTPYVVNNSNRTAFYKPEGVQNGVDLNPGYSSSKAYPIAPNTDLYAPVDGVATHKYNNAVFKVLTGTNNIRINQKGDVSARTHPVVVDGWISRGGYYYENGGLLTPGLNDGSWEKLFDRAKSTGGVRY